MNITMHETRRGSEDGFRIIQYQKGVVYFDVPHSLVSSFIRNGSAREATLQDMDDQLERAKEAI